MKKQIFRGNGMRVIAGRFILTTLFAAATLAGTAQSTVSKSTTVAFVQTQREQLVFKVNYQNVEGDKFEVVVKDADGSVLHQSSYTNKVFSKFFLIPKTESVKPVFVIRNLRTNKTEVFEVNTNVKVIEEVLVTKG
ncbi:MAG: hypothetical protein H7Y27_00995 [Gemmatimonadaceae bacterium]|nr:hypothetical protein [Chitinophagaceae bacterium]